MGARSPTREVPRHTVFTATDEIHTLVTGSVEDAYFVRSECANDFPGSEWTLGEVRA